MTKEITTFLGVAVSPKFVITDLDKTNNITLLAECHSEAQSLL